VFLQSNAFPAAVVALIGRAWPTRQDAGRERGGNEGGLPTLLTTNGQQQLISVSSSPALCACTEEDGGHVFIVEHQSDAHHFDGLHMDTSAGDQ
jgi:hypothetical protein